MACECLGAVQSSHQNEIGGIPPALIIVLGTYRQTSSLARYTLMMLLSKSSSRVQSRHTARLTAVYRHRIPFHVERCRTQRHAMYTCIKIMQDPVVFLRQPLLHMSQVPSNLATESNANNQFSNTVLLWICTTVAAPCCQRRCWRGSSTSTRAQGGRQCEAIKSPRGWGVTVWYVFASQGFGCCCCRCR